MQRSALCRSRRELSNEYLLAKIGVDTAENEPLEVWRENIQYYQIVSFRPSVDDRPTAAEALRDPWILQSEGRPPPGGTAPAGESVAEDSPGGTGVVPM